MKSARFALGVGALIIASGFVAAPTVQAAEGSLIQAGAAHPTQPTKSFEYTRFYPERLQIHRGQTVTFQVVGGNAGGATGFHSVAFMPSGGPERPGFLRADELPGYHNLVEDWWRPSPCGHQGQSVCQLTDTNTFFSSGIPPLNPGGRFSINVDLPNGDYSYVCTVHASMRGTLEVVGDEVPVASQEQIDAQRVLDIAADTVNAEALEQQDPGFRLDGDRKIWNVLLGDSTSDNHVAINQFIPASLEIAPGDQVRYEFDDQIIDELHSVSFPSELSGDFNLGDAGIPWGKAGFGFFPRCDPDDPHTGATGVPGLFGVTPMPCAGNIEFGAAPWMTSPLLAPGNAVTPGVIHDSGILAPIGAPASYRAHPGTGGPLPSSFEAEFPLAGRFAYECNIHSDPMVGSITVS